MSTIAGPVSDTEWHSETWSPEMFASLTATVGEFEEVDISPVLQRELAKSVDVLDLTEFQRGAIHSRGINNHW